MASATKNLSSGPAGLEPTISAQVKPIPFRTELSLAPLLAFWARAFGDDTSLEGTFARTIREETEKAPELLSPITDLAVIARHRKLVDVLMAAVFPAAVLDREYGAAIAPFQLTGFYATPPFQQLLLAEDGGFRGRMSMEASPVNAKRPLRAYALVLARVYSIELDLDYSFIFTVTEPETGLDRHFKGQFDLRFVEVVPVGPTPPLTEEVRRRLHGNLLDADFLRQILPPENFVLDRKSTRLNSSHGYISYAVFCLKKKKKEQNTTQDYRGITCLAVTQKTKWSEIQSTCMLSNELQVIERRDTQTNAHDERV